MVRHDILCTVKGSYSELFKLWSVYKQNYGNMLYFSPIKNFIISSYSLYFFTLYDKETLNVIASCSVDKISDEEDLEICNVFVEESYRGNNYSVLLILNVLLFLEQKCSKKTYVQIRSSILNFAAFYCYRKVFGEHTFEDNDFFYFDAIVGTMEWIKQ